MHNKPQSSSLFGTSIRTDQLRSSGRVDPSPTSATVVYISSDEDDIPAPTLVSATIERQSHPNGGRRATKECHHARLNDCWDTHDVVCAPSLGDGVLVTSDDRYNHKYYSTSRVAAQQNILTRTRDNQLANESLSLEFPADFGFRIMEQTNDWTDEEAEMLRNLRNEAPSTAPGDAGSVPALDYRPITEHYVFEPTPEVYGDFGRMIEEIQKRGGHRNGVIKIRIPKEWSVLLSGMKKYISNNS